MSYNAAAERGSQPAQRDELAYSQFVPIGEGVLPLTIDTSPPATTGILESLARYILYLSFIHVRLSHIFDVSRMTQSPLRLRPAPPDSAS